jgi:hypothetical protein
MSGIVCKLWNISGDIPGKTGKANLSDSMRYILNKDKTRIELEMDPLSQLSRECKYVENDLKTFEGAYVGGHNVMSTDVGNAVNEMMQVKNFYNKLDGRTALHMMISLEEFESDTKNASKLMKLCNDVLKELFPDNQAIFAIHTNTDNLHAHIIINSVGLNGKKIHQDNNFVKKVVHEAINRAAKKYGFTENDKWKKDSGYTKNDYVDLKVRARAVIDAAIESSNNFDEFVEYLRNKDVKVNVGKYLSLKLHDEHKAIRSQRLGKDYTIDRIVERIRTKKEAFEDLKVGRYVLDKDFNIYKPATKQLKRYKDMSKPEQKEVIRLLKVGRNPWRENSKKNWQLNKAANEINSRTRILTYMEFYSTDGTVQGTLDGILEAKKKVMHDKAMIRYAKRKYKPIIDIYTEMKQIERAAYLFEHCGMTEFQPEHEKYRQLTLKLKNIYNKDIFEVSNFLNECEERYLYAAGQLDELSKQYIEVKRYGLRHGEIVKEKNNLLDAVEYYSDHEKFKQGTFTGGMDYIASRGSEYVMYVTRSVYKQGDGTSKIYYNIDIYDKNGNIVETVTDYNDDHFDKQLKDLQKKYGFDDCYKFNDYVSARHFAKNNVSTKDIKNDTRTEPVQNDEPDNTRGEKTENVKSGARDDNHVDITINVSLVEEENNFAVKTRVPGTYGDEVRYLWINKNDMLSINGDKTILSYLDLKKGYELYDKNNNIASIVSGKNLYEHYDPVRNGTREHNEKNYNKR